MADNKRKRGGADKRMISLSEAYEVHYWSRKFKVTPAKLRAAVKRVGHSARAVEQYLEDLAHRARDRARISLGQAYEVRYWTKKFNLPPTMLPTAVERWHRQGGRAYLGIGSKRKAKKSQESGRERKGTARRRRVAHSPAKPQEKTCCGMTRARAARR